MVFVTFVPVVCLKCNVNVAFVCGSGAIVWPSVGIVLVRKLRAKFTIPYSCVHLLSISGQCDRGLKKKEFLKIK